MTNQLGFMVVGIGIGTELAINGAVAHAFADILFKGLLFMAMGAVLYRVGHVNGSDLGGLYKSMPITTGLCIIGAASISAFPLFSAFATKSLIMSAASHEGYLALWLVLLFASAGVFHHAGIKIPFFAFFHHDAGHRCKEAPRSMLVAMILAAAASMTIGLRPNLLYGLLPYAVDYAPYTWTHVITQSQLLFFSALAFATLMRTGLYPPELRSVNLDADWFYRRVGYRLWESAATAFVALHRAGYSAAGRLAATALAVAPASPGSAGPARPLLAHRVDDAVGGPAARRVPGRVLLAPGVTRQASLSNHPRREEILDSRVRSLESSTMRVALRKLPRNWGQIGPARRFAVLTAVLLAQTAGASEFSVRLDDVSPGGVGVRVSLLTTCTSYECGRAVLTDEPPSAARPALSVERFLARGGVVRGSTPEDRDAWWVVVETGGGLPLAMLWRPPAADGDLPPAPAVEKASCRVEVLNEEGAALPGCACRTGHR